MKINSLIFHGSDCTTLESNIEFNEDSLLDYISMIEAMSPLESDVDFITSDGGLIIYNGGNYLM